MNSPDESMQQLRVRILRRAIEAFGDEGQAREWLQRPNRALRVPASVLPERCSARLNPAHDDLRQVREVSRAQLNWPGRLVAYLKEQLKRKPS